MTLQEFVATQKHKEGKKAGLSSARSTMVNIFHIFKTVWDNAVVEHRGMTFDPLKGLKRHLPKKGKKKVEVFRFNDWETLLASTDEFYLPVAKQMVLTGLMASEIAALKASHIRDGYLCISRNRLSGRWQKMP